MDEKIWQEIDEREPIPENIKQRMEELRAHRAEVIDDKYIKRPTQIEGIRRAGVVNTGLLDYIGTQIHDGMSTQEIDDIVAAYTKEHGGICACLNYEGFPKNVCVSINEEVCHGIPSRLRRLQDGDIVNVDVSTIYKGYLSDASRMFCIGNVSPARRKLVDLTKECLERGVAVCHPYAFTGDIGEAIQTCAEHNGCSVVRDLGGHSPSSALKTRTASPAARRSTVVR